MVQKSIFSIIRTVVEALTLRQIAEYADGELRQGEPSRLVRAISTDSRTLLPDDLFLALCGDHFDGHDYVHLAASGGALGAIVKKGRVSKELPANFALIVVEDTLIAYQQIAARYRQSLPLKVVAITGSNGKTSTKDLTAAVLGQRFRVLKTEGNFNNHIGVPRMLLQADRGHEIAVLEMGMNHPGEIAPLAAMALPDVAIVTNIGTAHLEFMGSREAIAQEKGSLAESISRNGIVILDGRDDFFQFIAQRSQAEVFIVGSENAPLRAEMVTQSRDGSRFTVVSGQERIAAMLPIPGAHMVTNALFALAVGVKFGLPLRECVEALAQVTLTKGRLELKTLHGRTILDDTYNANPESMAAAIKTLAAIPTAGRRIAILGRMGELGTAAEQGYRRVGEVAAQEAVDYLVTVGMEAKGIAAAAEKLGLKNVVTLADTDEAARWLNTESRRNDLILIKGSRSATMERILSTFALQFSDVGTAVSDSSPVSHAAP